MSTTTGPQLVDYVCACVYRCVSQSACVCECVCAKLLTGLTTSNTHQVRDAY